MNAWFGSGHNAYGLNSNHASATHHPGRDGCGVCMQCVPGALHCGVPTSCSLTAWQLSNTWRSSKMPELSCTSSCSRSGSECRKRPRVFFSTNLSTLLRAQSVAENISAAHMLCCSLLKRLSSAGRCILGSCFEPIHQNQRRLEAVMQDQAINMNRHKECIRIPSIANRLDPTILSQQL